MKIARLGLVIGAGVILEVIVGGILVLEAVNGLSVLQALLLLVVVVQLVALAVWWLLVSERVRRDAHADRGPPRTTDRSAPRCEGLEKSEPVDNATATRDGPAREERDRNE